MYIKLQAGILIPPDPDPVLQRLLDLSSHAGCKNLWAEVLHSAIRDYDFFWENPADCIVRYRNASWAYWWVFGNSTEKQSCFWVCQHLFTDPAETLAQIKRDFFSRRLPPRAVVQKAYSQKRKLESLPKTIMN